MNRLIENDSYAVLPKVFIVNCYRRSDTDQIADYCNDLERHFR